jgi:predicted RNA-binding Zn ribbon-like protein
MSQSATRRWDLRDAPDGFALVQEFLNTRPIPAHGPDLLATPATASAWAAYAVCQWSRQRQVDAPAMVMTEADLDALRGLRATVERLVDGVTSEVIPAAMTPAMVIPGPGGAVQLAPTGAGWQWLASALWIEVFRAQQTDIWSRLRLCRNTECASAFYDTSRNRSGVWHNVRTCGNAANLRASRERRRAHPVEPV